MRYTLILLAFLASCGHTFKEYPPYRVEQLSDVEQELLMEELLDSMRVEAIEAMETHAELMKDYHFSGCNLLEVKNFFNVRVNGSSQLLIQGEPGTWEEVPAALHRFYTFNRNLTDEQTMMKIAQPDYEGYNYPFFSIISRKEVLENIDRENELLRDANDHENYDFVEFHKHAIKDWQKKIEIMDALGIDELQEIHQQAQIEISTYQDSSGFSKAGKLALKGMYLVRNTVTLDYLGCSYIDLFYRSVRLKDPASRRQFKAINMLYSMRITDDAYLKSRGLWHLFFTAEPVATPPPMENF